MSAPASARRLSAQTRREQILEVAEALFIERGFEGVGMNDLARSLGTSRPTVYTYFTSTEEMLRALLDARLPALWERLSPPLPGVAGARPGAYSALFLELLQERELLLLMHSGGGPIFRAQRDQFLTRLAGLIEPHRLEPAQRSPGALELLTLLLEAAAVQALRHPGRDPAILAQTLGRFLAGGLGALESGT